MKRWIHASTTVEDAKEEFKDLISIREGKFAGRVWTDGSTWVAWKPRKGRGKPFLVSCDIDDYIVDREKFDDSPIKLGLKTYSDPLIGESQAFRYAQDHGFLDEWLDVRFGK